MNGKSNVLSWQDLPSLNFSLFNAVAEELEFLTGSTILLKPEMPESKSKNRTAYSLMSSTHTSIASLLCQPSLDLAKNLTCRERQSQRHWRSSRQFKKSTPKPI